MLKDLLIVAATEAEAAALKRIPGLLTSGTDFQMGGCKVTLLVTGVGSVATSWAMAKWLSANSKPGLAINIGIAGSFRDSIQTGDVVIPVNECFADAGIEEPERFLTLAEAGLSDPDQFPFTGGRIIADNKYIDSATKIARPVNAITVNSATGSVSTIEKLVRKYNPDIETMEGATFFYICSREKIPFLAIRSISNRVEPRNKNNWNIPLALDKLSEKLREIILMFIE
jgi:futalosine hydrolase